MLYIFFFNIYIVIVQTKNSQCDPIMLCSTMLQRFITTANKDFLNLLPSISRIPIFVKNVKKF